MKETPRKVKPRQGLDWNTFKSQMLPSFARKPTTLAKSESVPKDTAKEPISLNQDILSTDQDIDVESDNLHSDHKSNPAQDMDSHGGNDDDHHELSLDHHVFLKGHTRPITALAIDPSGTRMVTCSSDSIMKLWDFSGMDASFQPFKSWDPDSGQHAIDIQWSLSGDRFLVAFNNHVPFLYDRNGTKIAEFAKGDPYIRDQRHTDGHIAALTCICWHPLLKKEFASAGADSTVRIWDTSSPRKNKSVIVYKCKPGQSGSSKYAVQALTYSIDGQWLAAGSANGSVCIWKAAGPSYSMPVCSIPNAHTVPGVMYMRFGLQPTFLYTRGSSGDIKKWDLTSSKLAPGKLLNRVVNAMATHPGSQVSLMMGGNLALSPCHKYLIFAGTASDNKSSISVLSTDTLRYVQQPLAARESQDLGLGKLFWCTFTNQIAIATSQGAVLVLYDPSSTTMGVSACIERGVRKRVVDHELEQVLMERAGIELESAVALVQTSMSSHGNKGSLQSIHLHNGRVPKKLLDTLRGHTPQKRTPAGLDKTKPVQSQGGGSIHIPGSKKANGAPDEDPRAAILKYAQIAAEEPYWISPAYNATQPKPVLAEEVFEQDELERVIANEDRQRVKRRREF